MPINIAVAGKGGTGKTTFAALLIKYLEETKEDAILAVDADPNSNLHEALGLELGETIADFLDDTKQVGLLPAGMTKTQYIQYKLQSSIIETKHVDLLSMGAPEGPGCYCYPNDLLRQHLENISSGYDYMVVDNEAGLEHLSRRVAQNIDHLFVISDPTARGVRSAARVHDIIKKLSIKIDNLYLVITRSTPEAITPLQPEIDKADLQVIGTIPRDEELERLDLEGRPLVELPGDAKAVAAIRRIAEEIGL